MADNVKQKHQLHCSFCAKSQDEVKSLVAGPDVYICDECTDFAKEVINKQLASARSKPGSAVLTPRQIDEHLGHYVIGQHRARRVMAVALHNHYIRLQQRASKDAVELKKSNILLIGGTGTGKTYIAETLARIIDVPFAIADATTLTQAGYVGEDVESIITKLYLASGGDVEKTQRGIIYIDEIDKISRKGDSASLTRDVSGEGVQQALLKIIEGSVCNISPVGGRKNPEQQFVQIDTKDILFICGGAFPGLEKIISARLEDKSIGFGASIDANEGKRLGEILEMREPDDITKFGLIPEFVGRLPVIATLHDLDEDAMVKILTEPKDAIVKQFHELFMIKNVDLRFTEEGLRAIAAKALGRKTGARGLRSILEEMLNDTMYDLPDIMEEVEAIEVGADTVKKGTEPMRVPRAVNDDVAAREAV